MEGVGWISFLFIGLIAGWLARRIMDRRTGLFRNLVAGVVGAYLGAAIFSAVGLEAQGGFLGHLIMATIGAIVLLFLTGILLGRGR
jgi:uncharacterized membrane protein YeaQ/YmgE (transglycosylase-associated protein family)